MDLDGNDATGRLQASWWCLGVPGGAVRMKTCSDAMCVGSSQGRNMADSEQAFGLDGTSARGLAGQRENRRTAEELTADSLSRPVGSGRR